MYANGKVPKQTWRDEENQSESCCLVDSLHITNIISSRGQKRLEEKTENKQTKQLYIKSHLLLNKRSKSKHWYLDYNTLISSRN